MKKKILALGALLLLGGSLCFAGERNIITVNTSCGKVAYLDADQIKTADNAVAQAELIDATLCP